MTPIAISAISLHVQDLRRFPPDDAIPDLRHTLGSLAAVRIMALVLSLLVLLFMAFGRDRDSRATGESDVREGAVCSAVSVSCK